MARTIDDTTRYVHYFNYVILEDFEINNFNLGKYCQILKINKKDATLDTREHFYEIFHKRVVLLFILSSTNKVFSLIFLFLVIIIELIIY